ACRYHCRSLPAARRRLGNCGGMVSLDQPGIAESRGFRSKSAHTNEGAARWVAGVTQYHQGRGKGTSGPRLIQSSCRVSTIAERKEGELFPAHPRCEGEAGNRGGIREHYTELRDSNGIACTK